jgi:hypothetical protein
VVSGRHKGRVVDADGQVVAGALVTIVSASAPVPEIALVTDEDGSFSLGLPRGRFRLRASTVDQRSGEAEIDSATEAADDETIIHVG